MAPSSKHTIQASSSLVRNIKPPLHTKFYRLAEEFHRERGLPLDGVDPHSLIGNNDIFEEDWAAVFVCPKPIPGSQKKVKAYHVWTEFLQKLVRRHWDVYQEGPFIEGNESLRERHNLQNKIKRWEEQMSGRGRGSKTTTASTRSSLKTKGTSIPLSSVPTEGCLVQLAEEDSKALAKMKNIAEERLQDYKSRLEGAKKQVENQVRELHREEGAQSSNTLAIKLQTEIDCMQDHVARQRLVDLIGQFLSTTKENLAKLEAKMARAKALVAEVEANLAQESEHFKFCVSMERTPHNVGASLMKSFPPVDFEQSISEVAIQGFYHCVGCGFPFDARSLDVFSLPCTHVYHMLCFVHVCRDYGYCVAVDCNMHVPPRAKHMIGLKVKSEMKESSAGTDIAAETCIQESLRTTTERVSMQATEQSLHACSNKTMHSTRKNSLITPGMQPALEAESAIGDEVRGVVEDILMAKSSAVKSPRQQLTPSCCVLR
ncbi:hypothetical protein L7F22_019974 [Adiantum nelumboides]|nr:hypothetical protein [Adiantum nelumboides]